MKTVIKSIEVTAKNFRIVPGKTYGFLKTNNGDIFVSPPEVKKLTDGYKYANIKQGLKGMEAVLASFPTTETTLEASDYNMVEQAALRGELYSTNESISVWKLLPSAKKSELEKINSVIKEKKKWAGLSTLEIISKIESSALESYENNPYEQATVEHYALWAAQKAQAAGIEGLEEFINKQELALKDMERAQEESSRLYQESLKNEELEFQQELTELKTLLELPTYKTVSRSHACMIGYAKEMRNGVAAKEILNSKIPKIYESGPDTFGFCHGTDFEGGTW